MGSILINTPDFADDELVVDAKDTKQILCFFCAHYRQDIHGVQIGNEARRLAQTALIAAVEGTYAMGVMDRLLDATFNPGMFTNFGKWTLKLFQNLAKYLWKYVKAPDLMQAKVYHSVKNTIAGNLAPRVAM